METKNQQRAEQIATEILQEHPEKYPNQQEWAKKQLIGMILQEMEEGYDEEDIYQDCNGWMHESWDNRE
jgi:hypothetical protein